MNRSRARAHTAGVVKRSAERGSAYLFVLLILLVLTVIGLALSVITQTEVQIGGAEKSATRVFYASDSGVRLQLAFAQTQANAPKGRIIADEGDVLGETVQERIETAPMLVMYSGDCTLCTNNFGGDQRFYAVNSVTNAESRRLGVGGSVDLPQSSRLISLMFFVQPQNAPGIGQDMRQFDPDDIVDDAGKAGLDVIRY